MCSQNYKTYGIWDQDGQGQEHSRARTGMPLSRPPPWFFTCFLISPKLLLPHFTQIACSGKGDNPSLICFRSKISTAIGNTPEDRNITKPLFCVHTSISSHLSDQSELLSPCLKRQGHLIHNNFLFPFSQRLYSVKHDGPHSTFACQWKRGQGSARTERILPLPTQQRRNGG